jgi:hypothetical protein
MTEDLRDLLAELRQQRARVERILAAEDANPNPRPLLAGMTDAARRRYWQQQFKAVSTRRRP